MKKLFFVIIFLFSPLLANADATTSITIHANVNVRYGSELVWSGQVGMDENGTTTIADNTGTSHFIVSNSALGALSAADALSDSFSLSDLAYYPSYDSYIVNCIDISASSTHACYNWQYVVNSTYPSVGASEYRLSEGDTLYFYFGTPRRFSVSATSTYATIPVSVLAESYDYTNDSWHPLGGTVVGATQPNPGDPYSPLVPFQATTVTDGAARLRVNTSGTYDIGLASDFYYPTKPLSVLATTTNDVILRVRVGADVTYEGVLPLPTAGTTTVADSAGDSYEINSRSVLNVLTIGDAMSDSFSISNLEYYSSYGSFYIKCLNVSSVDKCDNWQYAVNGNTPGASADTHNLSGGEELYFYFASPQRVSLSGTSIAIGNSVTATAESYRASDNSYLPLNGITFGLSRDSIILSTSTADNMGQSIFSPTATGTYEVGIYNDGAYGAYLYPSTSLIVTAPADSNNGGSSGGGTGGGSSSGGDSGNVKIDSSKAIEFLVSKQRTNGSFGASLYTDWASVAFGSASVPSDAKQSLKDYLMSNQISGSIATDYERRAMALMSLGINPYSGTSVDYIGKIVSFFDGNQIGDSGLVNDDIFAIFPLMNAGYTQSDEIIKKAVEFILARQSSNGSWESVDMTAAAIQALKLTSSISGVQSAISKAKDYIKAEQASDGGFGNISSTSWTIQAIAALGETNSSWTKDSKTPGGYLVAGQSLDGGWVSGSSDDSRVWQTSYAIVADYGRTWNSVMANFYRPIKENISQTGSAGTVYQSTEALNTENPNEISVHMDISVEDFIRNYNEAIKNQSKASPIPKKTMKAKSLGPQGFDLSLIAKKPQFAGVAGALIVGTSTPPTKNWFTPLLKFFGL